MQNFRPGQKVRYIGSGFPDNSVKKGDIGVYLGPDEEFIGKMKRIGTMIPIFMLPAEAQEAYAALMTTIMVQHDDGGPPKRGTADSWEPVDDNDKDKDTPRDHSLDQTPGNWEELTKTLGFDPRERVKEKACLVCTEQE